MKAGWKTTEFWMTIVVTAVGLLAALGVIGPADRPNVEGALQQMVQSVAGFIAAAIALWRYIKGRVDVKNEDTRAQAQVMTQSRGAE